MIEQRLAVSNEDRNCSTAETLFNVEIYHTRLSVIDTALHRLKRSSTSVSSLFSNSRPYPANSMVEIILSPPTSKTKVEIQSIKLSRTTTQFHRLLSENCTTKRAKVINMHLLRCVALSQCNLHSRALSEADIAFSLATNDKIFHMICKSQLYRGICLNKMGELEDVT